MRRAAVGFLGAVVLLAASAPFFMLRLHPDDLAIVSWRAGGTPELRTAAVSFRLPFFQRVQIYPRGRVEVQAVLGAASREGTRVDLPYTVKVEPDPQELLQLFRDGAGGGAPAAVRTLVEDRLRKAAAAA